MPEKHKNDAFGNVSVQSDSTSAGIDSVESPTKCKRPEEEPTKLSSSSIGDRSRRDSDSKREDEAASCAFNGEAGAVTTKAIACGESNKRRDRKIEGERPLPFATIEEDSSFLDELAAILQSSSSRSFDLDNSLDVEEGFHPSVVSLDENPFGNELSIASGATCDPCLDLTNIPLSNDLETASLSLQK